MFNLRFNYLFGSFGSDIIDGTPGSDIVFAFGGADEISTGEGDDKIFAGFGADIVDAGAGDDSILAGLGDDTVVGGEGDDYINGGLGYDTVTYEGRITDYDIELSDLWYRPNTITSLSTDYDDAGTDRLVGVEAVFFALDNYTLLLNGDNNAALARDDTATTDEDSSLTIAAATLLDNDLEFDGDTLTISALDTASTSGATISFDGDNIVYDPGDIFADLNDGETATDTFTYTADDGNGGTSTATVTVTITGSDDAPALEARINEFHYDNAGSDEGEFVEIRVNTGADVSGLILELYNGNGGATYGTLDVADFALTSDETYDYYVLTGASIQNGGPDGLALSNDGTLIEFLSYEGTFDGVGGTADGVTSTDVGVSEAGDTEIGLSLSRNDDGTWNAPATATAGLANDADVPPTATTAQINEFHYDTDGSDTGEFIEIRVDADEDVSALTVDLYNGNGGSIYNSYDLADATLTSDGTYDYYVIDTPGIQNGPDGIALSNDGTLVEFLSYEGEVTGTEGPANGVTSTDIGVSENSADAGTSLQLQDDGTWAASATETRGAANDTVVAPAIDALISEIQGSGDASTLEGENVNVTAVVTHVVSSGYYLQEEDGDADADDSTSEGIFVFSSNVADVQVGDLVSVTGEVDEYFESTQITNVTSEVITASDVDLPTAAEIMISPDAVPDYEAIEGMRVSVSSGTTDPLTVIENFNFDRFGQIVISAGSQTQATQLYDAQTEADEIAALQEQNATNRLTLDDGDTSQNPDAFEFVPGGAGDDGNGFLDVGDDFGDAGSTLRLGSEIVDTVEGVMNYSFGEYQLVVTETLEIDESTNSGARQDTPNDVGGDIQVASVNVLNYFSTIDVTGAGTGPDGDLDPRGADSEEELVRQTEKLVANITGTGAEVFALQEIENNGFGDDSALQTLVDALNVEATDTGSGASYAFVDPSNGTEDFIGTDAIQTAIIYDENAVTLVSSDFIFFDEASAATTFALAEVMNPYVPASAQVGDFQRNRPSVAATFEDNETGETFTVVSSHFKSKGDSDLQDLAEAAQDYLDGGGTEFTQADIDALIADPNYDQDDGQAYWNQVRLDAATELADWIANDYNGTGVDDYLLLGDMNAYAEEDPVQYLDDEAGLVDLIDTYIGQDEAYSFVFDGQQGTLDQGFASAGLADNVTGATEWHINADEPDLINYDNSFKDDAFYNDGVYASSDHDPLIIGLDLEPDPIA